jgi:hypothetical protein
MKPLDEAGHVAPELAGAGVRACAQHAVAVGLPAKKNLLDEKRGGIPHHVLRPAGDRDRVLYGLVIISRNLQQQRHAFRQGFGSEHAHARGDVQQVNRNPQGLPIAHQPLARVPNS